MTSTKDADGQGPAPAESYSSATEAVDAIISHHKQERLRRSLGCLPPECCLPPPNWSAAATAIRAGTNTLSLDGDRFWHLEIAIQGAPDREARNTIHSVTRNWAEENWGLLNARLREEALERFRNSSYPGAYEFDDFVSRWPRLRQDSRLMADAVRALEQGRPGIDVGVAQLRALEGDRAAAAGVLAAVMAYRSSFRNRDDLASLFAEWAGEDVWGQLQHLLWRVGTETQREQKILTELPRNILNLAALLREFGFAVGEKPGYRLFELSAETKASWRRLLKAAVGDDPALRLAVAEALLWFGSTQDDRAVLFAVLELYEDGVEAALIPLRDGHPDDLVRLRAAAVIDMVRGEPDALELLRPRHSTATARHLPPAEGLRPARTWIRDARIELLIEDTLDKAARNAGADISRTLASGEETHVAVLFERLRGACSTISDRLATLADETNANDRLRLKLEHRIVGKPEEGGPGVGTTRFSTDVCLLFEARDSGKRFARRASFLQAKRLYRRKKALDVDYYPVDRGQLADLAGQTMASFLLLVGPECDGVGVPVIPARLFLDLVERGDSSTQIAPADASRLGKGIKAVQRSLVGWTEPDL